MNVLLKKENVFSLSKPERKPIREIIEELNKLNQKEISNQAVFYTPIIMSPKNKKKFNKIFRPLEQSHKFNHNLNITNYQELLAASNDDSDSFMLTLMKRFNQENFKKSNLKPPPIFKTHIKEFKFHSPRKPTSSRSVEGLLTPEKPTEKFSFCSKNLNNKLYSIFTKIEDQNNEAKKMTQLIKKNRVKVFLPVIPTKKLTKSSSEGELSINKRKKVKMELNLFDWL